MIMATNIQFDSIGYISFFLHLNACAIRFAKNVYTIIPADTAAAKMEEAFNDMEMNREIAKAWRTLAIYLH